MSLPGMHVKVLVKCTVLYEMLQASNTVQVQLKKILNDEETKLVDFSTTTALTTQREEPK